MTNQPKLLRDHILDSLRHAILTGQYEPGDRIVELEIAKRFEVSQGPVREALQRLLEEGLVESKRHRGTFVSDVSYEEMEQIFAVRKVVEELAARSTAAKITPEQLQDLRSLVAAMHDAASNQDFLKLVDIDLTFHRRVCEYADQPVLLRVWNILTNHIHRFIVYTHPKYFPDLHELAGTHDPLLLSLEKKDPSEVGRLFYEHIDLIWQRIKQAQPESKHVSPRSAL